MSASQRVSKGLLADKRLDISHVFNAGIGQYQRVSVRDQHVVFYPDADAAELRRHRRVVWADVDTYNEENRTWNRTIIWERKIFLLIKNQGVYVNLFEANLFIWYPYWIVVLLKITAYAQRWTSKMIETNGE